VAAPAARTAAAGRVPARRRGQRPPFIRDWAAGWCGPRSRKSKRGGHGCPTVSGCTCTRPHRRSELVALTLDDVTLHATDGLHVRLRRSKTDQEALGTVKALPYGRDPVTCPPCAYVRWRPGGALFPTVHKNGVIGGRAMSGDAIAEMIQRRAGQAGYGPAQT